MIDEEAAIALARDFLQGSPGAGGPFSVHAEQDAWIVMAPGDNGETIMVYIDIDDGDPTYLHWTTVDVELRRDS